MIKYVIFDMDGVLFNSEPVTATAAQRALLEEGIKIENKDFQEFLGAGEDKFIQAVTARNHKSHLSDKILKRMYELFNETVFDSLEVFESTKPFINELKRLGFTLALASSTNEGKVKISLEAAGIPENTFTVLLTGSDVRDKKPNPEIYLKALEGLGANAAEAVVIEDAVTGIKAAKGAGIKCIAVTNSLLRAELENAGADVVIDDLSEALPVILGNVEELL